MTKYEDLTYEDKQAALDEAWEVMQLQEENKIMKDALKEIRWTAYASNPQAMMMKGVAQKALREVYTL